MPSYEIVEHSVEGTGENRHFFRVAVYRGKRGKATLPDVYAEFLLHATVPMTEIIEARVQQILSDETITTDEFTDKELKAFNLRRPSKKTLIEAVISEQMKGKRATVSRSDS